MCALKLNVEQQKAVELVLAPDWPADALFITGAAGTGKSTVLREIVDQLEKAKKQFAVLAPTGIAAINVKGQTIHSFFKFPPRLLRYENDEDIPIFSVASQRRHILRSLEYLIIDEISMVRVDVLDAIDFSLRENRERDEPFGGVKLILFGDVLQLEPVVPADEQKYLEYTWQTPFFFSARVWRRASLGIFKLTKIMRQAQDQKFASLLERVRTGDKLAFHMLRQSLKTKITRKLSTSDKSVVLTPYRKIAQRINEYFLDKINSEEKVYVAQIQGNIQPTDMPVKEKITLKKGAKVMIMVNNTEKGYINGDIGTVEELKEHSVNVRLQRTGGLVEVAQNNWEKYEFRVSEQTNRIEPHVVGQFVQLPIRLAWAITIHKAQGLTLDKVNILLGRGTFAHGQLYVALSRCRSLNDITIDRLPNWTDLRIRPEVVKFLDSIYAGKKQDELVIFAP